MVIRGLAFRRITGFFFTGIGAGFSFYCFADPIFEFALLDALLSLLTFLSVWTPMGSFLDALLEVLTLCSLIGTRFRGSVVPIVSRRLTVGIDPFAFSNYASLTYFAPAAAEARASFFLFYMDAARFNNYYYMRPPPKPIIPFIIFLLCE